MGPEISIFDRPSIVFHDLFLPVGQLWNDTQFLLVTVFVSRGCLTQNLFVSRRLWP